jgi:hypothetical protein
MGTIGIDPAENGQFQLWRPAMLFLSRRNSTGGKTEPANMCRRGPAAGLGPTRNRRPPAGTWPPRGRFSGHCHEPPGSIKIKE